ncbi:hypothetical protein EC968_001807, partial [Mortierella alpina]
FLGVMPMIRREGIFGVYQPSPAHGHRSQEAIHIVYPTPHQNTAIFILGTVFPIVTGVGCGVSSCILRQRGFRTASYVLEKVQFSCWVVTFWVGALIAVYSGLKFSAVLRAYILEAETKMNDVSEKGFGISNLRSESPARYLYIMLRITTYGACAVFALSGALCGLWAWKKDRILRMEDPFWPHVMAVTWTCASGLAFIVKLLLITVLSRLTKSGEYKLLNSLLPQASLPFDSTQHDIVPLQSPWQPEVASYIKTCYKPEGAGDDFESISSLAWRVHTPNRTTMANRDVIRGDIMSANYETSKSQMEPYARPIATSRARPILEAVTRPMSAAIQGWPDHPPGNDRLSNENLRTSSTSSSSFIPMPKQHMREYRSLRLQHRSVLHRMEELERRHQQEIQQPERLQRLRNLQQQINELDQHMRQLETFHTDFLLSQIHLQKTRRPGPAALSKNIRLRSNMMLLLQQVDFSLRIIQQQMDLH